MWKNEKDRELASKEMAQKFKEVFERTLLDKDIEALETIIEQLKQIKQVWEFGPVLRSLGKEVLSQTCNKIQKEVQNKKGKN